MAMRDWKFILFCLPIIAATNAAFGQGYPNKPIRIATAAAGGGSDFIARQISLGITGPLGQPVIVENRPSNLTAEAAMKAQPDGYTLLVEGNSFWVAPLIRKTPYEVLPPEVATFLQPILAQAQEGDYFH